MIIIWVFNSIFIIATLEDITCRIAILIEGV